MEGKQMWGGCFSEKTSSCLEQMNASINVDKRMYAEDIEASVVYARALAKIKIISQDDYLLIIGGLQKVKEEWDANKMIIQAGDEDIHSVNERRLREIIGEAADRLHTGRSRNDQVATDIKLWILNNSTYLKSHLKALIKIIINSAKLNIDVLMPGYTHLRRAQPVRWSHFILSHAWSLRDDIKLLLVLLERVAVLPLGSGALAGNPFPIDREAMAKELGFLNITMNSMNAVGNRDFIAEFLFWYSLCGTHLSRLAEDLIIFSTDEFGFIQISQQYSTGSSLLPQKRNPDGLELTRSVAAQLIGNTTTFLTALKSLPSTYNKDLQIDKKYLFESHDLICKTLEVVAGTIETINVNFDRCLEALKMDQLTTRLTYWLVKKGLPFRQAHHVAGQMFAMAESKKTPINCLSIEDRQTICVILGEDLSEVWNFEAAVEELNISGGTAKASVIEQIDTLENFLNTF